MSSTRKPTYRKVEGQGLRRAITLASVAVVCMLIFFLSQFIGTPSREPNEPFQASGASGQAPQEQRVSFVAVGDNLPDSTIGAYADACAGAVGDGLYDYTEIYRPIVPYVYTADLAYINFETHAGGDDIGPRGYPSFNTSDAMVDAIYLTGFDLIASATNHSYDWGKDALEHSVNLWKQKPVLFTGTATNETDAYTIQTIEKNGITFSLLNYTYSVNGYEESELAPYSVNFMNEERIRNDIKEARSQSDFVIVAMHWGTEGFTEADETQKYYAQLIADAGADIVLGSHPHVIGPVAWVEGSSGNKTLVAYSLGNFLSHHEYPGYLNELEGMLHCDFVKDANGTRIENISWIPLVNHSGNGTFAIYALSDYTDELASEHRTLSSLENPLDLLWESTNEIVGNEIEISH